VRAVAERLLADGFRHVCLVNNHLEPAHDAAVRAAAALLPAGAASVACPLTRRWGRTLSPEFKSGACHAGRYETSLVMAAGASVRVNYKDLPALDLSLSRGIQEGKSTFTEIGMTDAYTGAPAEATAAEGEELYARLADMIVSEVTEALGAA
jgi:creatinine amidohydrolase